jgi:putative FmdB family regulatory protein
MPTFDFQCEKCGAVFEFSRPFGSKTMPACSNCGGKKTEKLLTPPAVHFKGAGWYKTDSTQSTAPAAKTPEQKESVKTEATTQTTESAKIEAKTEPKKETAAPKTEEKKPMK